MKELEVALAIALSFLLFSTLVSMLLELYYRILNTRRIGLEHMLQTFYQKEFKEHLVLYNLSEPCAPHQDQATTFVNKLLMLSSKKDHNLSIEQFIKRLADTDIGLQIAKKGKQTTDALISTLVQRFDDWGKRESLNFKEKSQTINLLIAVLLALFFNVNIANLSHEFINNRVLTETMLANAEQIMASHQAQQEKLDTLLYKDSVQSTMKVEDYTRSVEKLQSTLQQARAFGLPVGWKTSGNFSYFEDTLRKLLCDDAQTCSVSNTILWVLIILYWLITTLMTGLLIGLGGPFWYDMVKRLMVFRTLASSAVDDKSTDKQAEQTISAPLTKANEIFSTAINIRLILFPQLNENQSPNALTKQGAQPAIDNLSGDEK